MEPQTLTDAFDDLWSKAPIATFAVALVLGVFWAALRFVRAVQEILKNERNDQ